MHPTFRRDLDVYFYSGDGFLELVAKCDSEDLGVCHISPTCTCVPVVVISNSHAVGDESNDVARYIRLIVDRLEEDERWHDDSHGMESALFDFI